MGYPRGPVQPSRPAGWSTMF